MILQYFWIIYIKQFTQDGGHPPVQKGGVSLNFDGGCWSKLDQYSNIIINKFGIFNNCSSLTSLNLSNFNTNYVHNMDADLL